MSTDSLNTEARESFIRWQGVTREHFTFSSNVVLGLATALLAFLSDRLQSASHLSTCALILGSIALLSLVVSIGLALWCGINRLADFRATAQVARRRMKGENVPQDDRLEIEVLGNQSWRLFKCQLVLFGIGAVTTALTLLARFFELPSMIRPGGLPGGLVSEVKYVHSNKVYIVSTAPEMGQDYWTTAIIPTTVETRWFGLWTRWVPDFNHQIAAIIRNTMKEAHDVHAMVQHILTMTPEADWLDSFPPPAPPDGYSPGARRKLRETLGYDPTE